MWDNSPLLTTATQTTLNLLDVLQNEVAGPVHVHVPVDGRDGDGPPALVDDHLGDEKRLASRDA